MSLPDPARLRHHLANGRLRDGGSECSSPTLRSGTVSRYHEPPTLNRPPGTCSMRICAFRSLRPRIPWSLLLSLLLLLMLPSAVQAAEGNEAHAPDCAQSGLEPRPVAVRLTRSAELVQATLHSPAGALPAIGCRVPLEFHIPADDRPYYAVWRDVEGRAVKADGTPDPAHPDPLPLRLWIRPDGNLEYEVREAEVTATHAALNLAVAWGTTGAVNDLAVLDILGATLGLELSPQKLGARLNDRGRVTELDWHANHPFETYVHCLDLCTTYPRSGLHPPGVRVRWQLPSELGQLAALSRLALGGPLLTGTIPPELGRLKNLEELTLAGSRLTGAVPPELGQLTRLRKLELHGNRLTALPPELGQLAQLVYLSLARNQLTSLPPELGQLTQLDLLGVAGNRLTELPPELGRLTYLRGLGVAGNRLTSLPPELGQLPHLRALDVQDNQLASLPSLAELDRLKYLNLSGNRLTMLPPGLLAHGSLLNLNVGDNQLQELPDELFMGPIALSDQDGSVWQRIWKFFQIPAVGRLQILDLSGNQLTTLPPVLGRLRANLLDLSDNQLTSLPPELGRLRRPLLAHYDATVTLDLSGNRLTELPPELGQIPDRLRLDLSHNQLTSLPESLWQLAQLEVLNLSGNRLGTVPPQIGDMAVLWNLGLGDNQLTTLPPELGQLPQLYSLDLSGNRLTELPPELAQASNLRHLNLARNHLSALPAGLGQLSQLDSLDLSGNQLMGLSNPAVDLEQVAQLPRRLRQLDLSDNQLTVVPPVVTQFRLEVLNLSRNQLTDLPPDLDQQKILKHLDLSHNQFSDIPPVLSRLRPLLFLDLRGNPLTTCPLPLPWQIDRYIFPPDYEAFAELDPWLLSPPPSAAPPDLPFLDLCPE